MVWPTTLQLRSQWMFCRSVAGGKQVLIKYFIGMSDVLKTQRVHQNNYNCLLGGNKRKKKGSDVDLLGFGKGPMSRILSVEDIYSPEI